MTGVAISIDQSNGVTTTWATVLDVRWQPGLSADVQVGFFVDEPTFMAGGQPVSTQYVALDITQIVPTGNIPAQIFAQLTAPGAILAGGTPTS
jgi:hypothetical protein